VLLTFFRRRNWRFNRDSIERWIETRESSSRLQQKGMISGRPAMNRSCKTISVVEDSSCRRRLIVKEPTTWAYAWPDLIRRIDNALRLPRLTNDEKLNLEPMSDQIAGQFRWVQQVVETEESCEHLIASMERLREVIDASEAILDRLLLART
jgi:hypothetical protein